MRVAIIGSGISGLLAARLLADDYELELGQYLDRNRYSREFIDHYLIPRGRRSGPRPLNDFGSSRRGLS